MLSRLLRSETGTKPGKKSVVKTCACANESRVLGTGGATLLPVVGEAAHAGMADDFTAREGVYAARI